MVGNGNNPTTGRRNAFSIGPNGDIFSQGVYIENGADVADIMKH